MTSRFLISESWSKRLGIRTIRAAHSHSPTNLRSCPFLWKEFVIPILRLWKICIRAPCHRFALVKALMSPGCRMPGASQPRRQRFCKLLVLRLLRLISSAYPNRRYQCTPHPGSKPSEYSGFGYLRRFCFLLGLVGSLSQLEHNETLICLCVIYTGILCNPD